MPRHLFDIAPDLVRNEKDLNQIKPLILKENTDLMILKKYKSLLRKRHNLKTNFNQAHQRSLKHHNPTQKDYALALKYVLCTRADLRKLFILKAAQFEYLQTHSKLEKTSIKDIYQNLNLVSQTIDFEQPTLIDQHIPEDLLYGVVQLDQCLEILVNQIMNP